MNYDKKEVKKIFESSCLIICVYLLIDMLNIPTIIFQKYNFYAMFFIIILGIFIVLNRGFINLIKINVKNYFDDMIVSSYIATLMYLIFTKIIFFNICKYMMLEIIFIFLTIIIIMRIIQIYITANKSKKIKDEINVYDIKKLYNKEINNDKRDIIFLEERDVRYDLLNRDKIINDLYNSIKFCRNDKTFVISLTGEWGSGKTTIINIVKQKLYNNEYIIIDEFEPWKYSNEKSLLFGMFDKIMEKLGINFSMMETKKFIEVCSSMIVSNFDAKVNLINKESDTINKIKNIINEYLKINNKRVLFIIDNIERTEANNILVILKTISNILNLDRFIYILSYDEKEMKDIFKNKLQLNYDYIEKVIQLPLRVPKISRVDIVKICNKSMENLLICYGIDEQSIEKYRPAINLFVKNTKNLRDFKRKVNSVVNSNFYNKGYLNIMDAFLIELIELENPMLYETIKENYKYFISEEKELIYGYEYQEPKEYNKEITEFFDKTFSDKNNKKVISILKLLFPNVETYISSRRNREGRIEFKQEDTSFIIPRDKEVYKDSIINRRIFNGKFFDLYFTRQTNAFVELDNKINDFVNKINKKDYDLNIEKECKELQTIVADLLFMYTAEDQKILLETLQLYLDKITKNRLILLIILIEFQGFIDNRVTFMGLSARKRLQLICSEIIKSLDEQEIDKFKEIIEISYKNMYFIRGILYWLNPKDKYVIETNQDIYNKLKNSYYTMLENVIKNNVNIYEKVNYNRYNLYCLKEGDRYKSQISNINKETVIKFLTDIINESISNKYGYKLDTQTLEKIKSYKEIDNLLNEINKDSLSEKEKFIISIYEKSKENSKDFDENTIYSDNYIELERI